MPYAIENPKKTIIFIEVRGKKKSIFTSDHWNELQEMSGFDMKSCGWELHVTKRVTSEHSYFHCGAKAGPESYVDSTKPPAERRAGHASQFQKPPLPSPVTQM